MYWIGYVGGLLYTTYAVLVGDPVFMTSGSGRFFDCLCLSEEP